MVGVAQLVEHLVVVQAVAGSSPVIHPTFTSPAAGEPPSGWCCRTAAPIRQSTLMSAAIDFLTASCDDSTPSVTNAPSESIRCARMNHWYFSSSAT